jgi:hypothetical protein
MLNAALAAMLKRPVATSALRIPVAENRHSPLRQSLACPVMLSDRQPSCCRWSIIAVVFTVPQEVADRIPKQAGSTSCFQAAQTLRTIGTRSCHLGAEIGFIAILHTCQKLTPIRALALRARR